MKKIERVLLAFGIIFVLAIGFLFLSDFLGKAKSIIALVVGILGLIAFLTTYFCIVSDNKKRQKKMDAVFADNNETVTSITSAVNIPCLLVDNNGNITWSNPAMQTLLGNRSLSVILPEYSFSNPTPSINVDVDSKQYHIMSIRLERGFGQTPLTFQYWIDRTEITHYKKLYEDNRPMVGLIFVDNLDDLASSEQFHKTFVLTEIERLVSEFAEKINGIYREYETGRFIVLFESKHLAKLEENRFFLLEQAHHIETGTSNPATLSIAIGVADELALSDDSAKQALDLALGRGGDQAVIKNGQNYSFYGGKHQQTAIQSRVKARLFSGALRQTFESTGDIFVMGHQNCDIDAFGSGIGIVACAKMIHHRAFFILDKPNETIQVGLDTIKDLPGYEDCIITPGDAMAMMHKDSVLVVVDTQRPTTTSCPELLDITDKIILIDHHRRSADYIDNSLLHFMESRASSACELVTEVIQYFDDSPHIPVQICSLLLAGITLDTKHFAFNAGSRTFEAAGYLRKNGADNSLVKQMFCDDISSYLSTADGVKNAEIIKNRVALTKCSKLKNTNETEKLVSAKISDQLINIRGIEAGFALGHDGDCISVSARSLGLINVQLICERLGGGGHLTMAGAQLSDVSIDQAYKMVKKEIEKYLEEVKQ